MAFFASLTRTHVVALLIGFLAALAIGMQWVAKFSPLSLFGGVAAAPSCLLEDGSGLKDEVYFVSCGGFF